MDVKTVTGQLYSNKTGRFHVPSGKGNEYIVVVYDYYGNGTHAEPMKSRTRAELIRSYKTIHNKLESRGLKPRIQQMANEVNEALKQFI